MDKEEPPARSLWGAPALHQMAPGQPTSFCSCRGDPPLSSYFIDYFIHSFPFSEMHQDFAALEVKALVNLNPCQNTWQ